MVPKHATSRASGTARRLRPAALLFLSDSQREGPHCKAPARPSRIAPELDPGDHDRGRRAARIMVVAGIGRRD
jgi:hypothetical protein